MSESTGSPDPLSILHVCAPAYVGGLESVVQGLSIGAARRGHRVGVVAVIEPGQDVSAFLEPFPATGVETLTFEVPKRGYLKERSLVKRTLLERRPDVLHVHGYRSDLLHGPTARALGIATVTTLHGSSRMGGTSTVFEWIRDRSLYRLDGVVAVSKPLADALVKRGVAPECVHEVRNAWVPPNVEVSRDEARAVLAVDPNQVVVGWVGRLIPVKGCDVFVRALAEVEGDRWVALVIGDGPERPRLESLSAALGLEGRLRFVGVIPDAARYLRAFDLFVLSSRSEGTPLALLEAMGAGVAAAATRVGGVPDIVRSREEGWIVPPEDPGALAAAIGEALADPVRRSAKGRTGKLRVRTDYDFDTWIQRHEAVYRAAILVRAKRS